VTKKEVKSERYRWWCRVIL